MPPTKPIEDDGSMATDITAGPVRRVMVGTDRSETAERAVKWAASFAERFDADLYVVQVIVPPLLNEVNVPPLSLYW